MASVGMSGLASGVDTAAIVKQLVAVEQQSVTQIQARQAVSREKSSAFSTFESRIASLKTAAEAIRYASDLRAYKVSSGDESIITATAASNASEGTHEIVINRLASAERKVHDGLAALDTLVGTGTFVYTYNGETRTVQTTDTTTLEGMRDLINNDGGNPGVTASVLQYGTGAQAYHLVLSGNDTGADYAITIEDGQTTLDAFKSATYTVTQTAQNSRIQVDGYPTGDNWIERSGNTLTDVLAGVTLELHTTTPDPAEPVRVSLTRDTEGLKDKLGALVTAYNNVVEYAKSQTAYDAATKTAGPLIGEYSITSILEKLRTPLVGRVTGFAAAEDKYSLAAQIGLSVDGKGKLTLDDDTFDDAVSDNYLGVLSLLGANRTGVSDSSNLRFYGARDSTTAGAYDVRAEFTDGVLTSASIKLAGEPESAWRAAMIEGNLIIGAQGKPEQNLQITGSYTGSGTATAQVRVRQGLGGGIFDAIDKVVEDTIDRSQKRLDDADVRFQASIEREQARVDRVAANLTAQYARLEQTLTMLQAQRGALSSLFTSSTSS
ncbi:MAG: flagellar filament capping protein FliD [Planctomycetota bacterium]|nr:flagellar filament capping protein FliD [Planctomycetota bacterium]